jgi:hypothetical protein
MGGPGVVPQSQTDPRPFGKGRINELARRATNKTMERVSERTALSKEWVLRELVDTYEAARASGSLASANRSLELVGKELGMFGDVPPPPPPQTLEDLPTAILEQILKGERRGRGEGTDRRGAVTNPSMGWTPTDRRNSRADHPAHTA